MTDRGPDEQNNKKNICANCGAENPPGVMICRSCGQLVTGAPVGTTYRLEESEILEYASEQLKNVNLNDRKLHFPEDATFAIQIREVDAPMVYSPEKTLLVGRRNKDHDFVPDIDLYPYAGFLLGVSRRHAMIYRKDDRLVIEDLGSSNGTFVNGSRIEPKEPYPLYDGVEVSLGKLHFTIRF